MLSIEDVDITLINRLEREIKNLDEKIKKNYALHKDIFIADYYQYTNYLEYIRNQKIKELNVLKDILKTLGIE